MIGLANAESLTYFVKLTINDKQILDGGSVWDPYSVERLIVDTMGKEPILSIKISNLNQSSEVTS